MESNMFCKFILFSRHDFLYLVPHVPLQMMYIPYSFNIKSIFITADKITLLFSTGYVPSPCMYWKRHPRRDILDSPDTFTTLRPSISYHSMSDSLIKLRWMLYTDALLQEYVIFFPKVLNCAINNFQYISLKYSYTRWILRHYMPYCITDK